MQSNDDESKKGRNKDLIVLVDPLAEIVGYEGLGIIYAAAVCKTSSSCYLSRLPKNIETQAASSIKKRFQHHTRHQLYMDKYQILIDNVDKNKVIEAALQTIDRINDPEIDSTIPMNAHTIEGIVGQEINSGNGDFAAIGERVQEGAKKYRSWKPSHAKDMPFNIYREYNHILRELQK